MPVDLPLSLLQARGRGLFAPCVTSDYKRGLGLALADAVARPALNREPVMQTNRQHNHNGSSFGLLAGFCLILVAWASGIPAVHAQTASATASSRPAANAPAVKSAKRYFVEFRSRSAMSYGHTFLVHGKLNAAGQVGQVTVDQVAGLHPATESSIPWMIGHIVPVISETGFSDGDIEDQYITARYLVLLTEAEYARISAFIKDHQRNSPLWHAVFYNCNAWVGDVAKFMGLKVPSSSLLFPDDYITALAKGNGVELKPIQVSDSHHPAAHQASAAVPMPVEETRERY
jgi:hypothetical protein